MTAVLLSYFYPPLNAPRAIQVERLVRHSRLPMRVLCSAQGAVPSRPGVEISQFPYRSPRWWHIFKQLLTLPDAQRGWAMQVARSAVKQGLVGRDDVLVTFGQPMSDHLAGLELKRRLGLPWIAHFSDPWSDNPYLYFLPFARGRLRRMEADVFSAADRLLFTSEETVELVLRKYPASLRDKTSVLPHAYDPALYGEVPPSSAADRDILIRYVGNFYRHRNPRLLVDALQLIHKSRPAVLDGVCIELVGRWVGHAKWSPAQYGLPEGLLRLRSPVPYMESLRLMSEASMLLLIDAPFEQNVFFPSKLVDYLGAARPILAITPPGTSARILKAAGGHMMPADSAAGIADGLVTAIERYRTGKLAAVGADALSQFSAKHVTARFDAMIERLASSKTSNQQT